MKTRAVKLFSFTGRKLCDSVAIIVDHLAQVKYTKPFLIQVYTNQQLILNVQAVKIIAFPVAVELLFSIHIKEQTIFERNTLPPSIFDCMLRISC